MKKGEKEKSSVIEKNLSLSVKEGSVASVSSSLGESYLAPFAIALNATTAQVGILHAVMELLPSIIQLKTSKLLETYTRKKLVLFSVFFRILLWIPIIFCGYLYYQGYNPLWLLISLTAIYYSFLAISQMAWFSWMGSLVPENQRGTYFSHRNKITGFWGLVAMILGGILLDSTKKIGIAYGASLEYTLLGFGLLFLIALYSRAWTYFKLKEQYEPTLTITKKDEFSFRKFLGYLTTTPFGKFVLFRGIISIGIAIAAPFWAIYMIRDLGFSYFWFTAVTVSGILFQLLFFPLLGNIADKYGNIAVMKTCINLAFLVPLAWLAVPLINNQPMIKIYLLLIPSLISGFVWAGYNLAANNYIYDSVKPSKRAYGIAYMNLFVGIGGFLGATLGALIAHINVTFMNPILFIFALSAILRFTIATIGTRHLEEVRNVKKLKSAYLYGHISPIKGIVRETQAMEHFVSKMDKYV